MPDELARLAPGDQGGGLWVAPAYRALGYAGALDAVLLHPDAHVALAHAANAAGGAGHGLLVWDGWRSLELQRTLHERYRVELERTSGLTGPALAELVARFVTDPDRRSAPPGHSTGGAVDLTLCDPASGAPRELGGGFDELTDRSLPGYYDERADGAPFARLRAALADALAAGGFVRLATEWWHFEYGTAYWSALTGEPARLTHPLSGPTM